jgi:hypothetical protein
MVLDSGSIKLGENQLTGLRFLVDVPSGDKDVVINSARIQFTAESNTSMDGDKVIEIEDSDNAAIFTTANTISSRDRIPDLVVWESHDSLNNIPDWSPNEAGSTQATPDLTSLVQKIIDKPGWESRNGMAFIISGAGEQHAYSHEGDTSKAPKLIISYSISANTVIVNDVDAPQILEDLTHSFTIPTHVYDTVGPFAGAFNVTATVFDGDDVGVGSVLVHVRYGTDGVSDYQPPSPKSKSTQGSAIPLKFVVTNFFGDEVLTPHSLPWITVNSTANTLGPVNGTCGNTNSEFAAWGGGHYQCNLDTALIPPGDVIIAINLDDGIVPSTISADREVIVEIKP